MERKAKTGYTVVVVEDDKYMRAVLHQYLSGLYNIEAFDNGLSALNYLQEGNIPDIIIADLGVPGLSGMELLEQIKASGFFKSIPVLILSANDSTEKRISCLNAGADDYIVKPFNPQELSARLNVILRRYGKNV